MCGLNDEECIGCNTYLCSGSKELVIGREVHLIFNYITNRLQVNRLCLYIFDMIERLLDRNINLAQLSYCNCVATCQCVLCQID